MTQQVVIDVIRQRLNEHAANLEAEFEADVMGFYGPIGFGMDDRVRDAVERFAPKRSKVAIVLDTPGGLAEVVKRIVDTIRHHYTEVIFVIPDRAMSAGTLLALSGDEVWMDYFSVLGPVDPQVLRNGEFVPALSWLIQYERLVESSKNGTLTTAELVLLQKMDLGEMQRFEEARELSVSLLKEWLISYKFKDWNLTETRSAPVDQKMREERAEAIARALSDPRRWHSHGRGIPMKELRGDELKLKIEDLGARPGASELVRSYLGLLKDLLVREKVQQLVHTRAYW